MNGVARATVLAALLGIAASPAMAGDDPPAWLRQAATLPIPTYSVKDAPAVVLVDDSTTTVGDDGTTTTSGRYAVKILVHEGRDEARYEVPYIPNQSKVRDFKAWVVREGGQSKSYGKNEIIDAAASQDDVYDEARMRIASAADDADTGAIFGCEYVLEDRPLFAQDEWLFQRRLPVVASRLTLALPAGWRAESVTFNHDPVEPTVAGSTYTWELRDLKPIPLEPSGPPVTNLAPRLAFTYYATDKAKSGRSFSNWTEVSMWATQLMGPQATPDAAMAAKAHELTASAADDLERIRAIGRFVQSVNYIAIQTNLARGGGYRPHPAVDVFAKSYGDCKDKANLMVTMLETVGVTAYPVIIWSGDPTYVRSEWAAPTQFNHCIVAVKVTADVKVPSVIDYPGLGRLLIFDPTDTETPVGDLPDHEQGSLALIVAGDAGSLVRMPETSAEKNRLDRETDAAFTVDGNVTATIHDRSTGQAAVGERRMFTRLSRAEYDRRITSWITHEVAAARISKIGPSDDRADNQFTLDVELAADHYAQIMQGRLFVFKPALVERLEQLSLTDSSRTQPIVLDGDAFSELARITLPEGFDVDELPDPVKLETPFGQYATTYDVKDGKLLFTRSLLLKRVTLPVSEYAAVRSFFEKVRAAEQSPVVLVRK